MLESDIPPDKFAYLASIKVPNWVQQVTPPPTVCPFCASSILDIANLAMLFDLK